MYAVIKTGGKQYRVQPGDLLVVEKLEGEPGAHVAFDQVLMIGEGETVTVGEPLVEGAKVEATLVETRKGVKIKVFKKIRRQGYRRTRGHRQFETVLRVTGLAGAGHSESWEGEIDFTPLVVLNARARDLARGMEAADVANAEKRAKLTARAESRAAKLAKLPSPKAAPESPVKAAAKKPAAKKAAKAVDDQAQA